MVKEKKAVSTLILILLILCSFVVGALISYVWVMSSFYVEPPPSDTYLAITDLKFPVDHADYFNVTVMNPSHSASTTNITQIYLTVEGDNVTHPVTATEPESYPIVLDRATTKTIKCNAWWGDFAGKNITAHVSALDAVGAFRTEETEFVGLNVTTHFDATDSIKYFNVTVTNDPASAINLTIKNVYYQYYTTVPQENMTVQLPKTVNNGTSVSLDCLYDWSNTINPTVVVETSEGYVGAATANASSKMNLFISDIVFNAANATLANVTVTNSVESATPVDITRILFTYENGTQYNIFRGFAIPDFPRRIETNNSETFMCLFPWMDYRDKNITVTAYTKQGFVSSSETKATLKPIVFEITAYDFNLTNTGSFSVNITNMASSTQEINITQIKLNDNVTNFAPQIIPVGEQRQINCGFDWTSLRDTTATITVNASGAVQSLAVTLPAVDLRISDTIAYNTTIDGFKYVNITIMNTAFSTRSVTITQILFKTENATDSIDGTISVPQFAPNGYILAVGTNVTIVCQWNWTPYLNKDLTVTVQMADGTTVSQTFHIS